MSASSTGFTAYSLLDSENHLGAPSTAFFFPRAILPMALEAPHCRRSTLDPRCRNMVFSVVQLSGTTVAEPKEERRYDVSMKKVTDLNS